MPSDSIDCDLVMQIAHAETIQEAWQVVREIARNCGFDNVMYGANRLREPGVFGDPSDTFLLSDLPQEFMDLFWGHELYRSTPVALWAAQNTGAVSLRYGTDLHNSGMLNDEQLATQEKLVEVGVTSGYIIAMHRPKSFAASILALINFGISHDETEEIWEEKQPLLEALAAIFHLKSATLPLPLKNKRLTRRQAEVLQWIGKGKTMADTAEILGLSSATVEKHLRQARETLGVATTTQAVLHAQINSQIFTVEQ